jgi:hypothetical protein
MEYIVVHYKTNRILNRLTGRLFRDGNEIFIKENSERKEILPKPFDKGYWKIKIICKNNYSVFTFCDGLICKDVKNYERELNLQTFFSPEVPKIFIKAKIEETELFDFVPGYKIPFNDNLMGTCLNDIFPRDCTLYVDLKIFLYVMSDHSIVTITASVAMITTKKSVFFFLENPHKIKNDCKSHSNLTLCSDPTLHSEFKAATDADEQVSLPS